MFTVSRDQLTSAGVGQAVANRVIGLLAGAESQWDDWQDQGRTRDDVVALARAEKPQLAITGNAMLAEVACHNEGRRLHLVVPAVMPCPYTRFDNGEEIQGSLIPELDTTVFVRLVRWVACGVQA